VTKPAEIVRNVLMGSTAYKLAGLTLLWVGLAAFVYVSMTDARSPVRRMGTQYAANLDRQFKVVFLPPRGAYMAWLQGCAAITLLALYGLLHSAGLLVATAAVLLVPSVVVGRLVQRRRERLNVQVHTFTLSLANALKTTASIGEALWITLSVTPIPLRQELETALKQVRVGSTLDNALLEMSARTGSTPLDAVVTALLIGRQTGGDLPRILERTANSLSELNRLQEYTNKVTRDAKLSVGIAALTTAVMAVMMPRFMPGFFDPVLATLKGQIMLVQAAGAYVLALFLAYRFTRTDI
jgi:tight adherence protein B